MISRPPRPGSKVGIIFDPKDAYFFDSGTELRLR
jgi:hypothetical protein